MLNEWTGRKVKESHVEKGGREKEGRKRREDESEVCVCIKRGRQGGKEEWKEGGTVRGEQRHHNTSKQGDIVRTRLISPLLPYFHFLPSYSIPLLVHSHPSLLSSIFPSLPLTSISPFYLILSSSISHPSFLPPFLSLTSFPS